MAYSLFILVLLCPFSESCMRSQLAKDRNCGQRGQHISPNSVTNRAWPWVALIGFEFENETRYACNGALINDQWVLTVARCQWPRKKHVVVLGDYDLTVNDERMIQKFEVAQFIKMPDYECPSRQHDLALLKLSRKVDYADHIRPICLPWTEMNIEQMYEQQVVHLGWNHMDSSKPYKSLLNEFILELLPPETCRKVYSKPEPDLERYYYPDGFNASFGLCAGKEDVKDSSCKGAEGSPLATMDADRKYTLLGLLTMGHNCNQRAVPAIYVPVFTDKHIEWIMKVAYIPESPDSSDTAEVVVTTDD